MEPSASTTNSATERKDLSPKGIRAWFAALVLFPMLAALAVAFYIGLERREFAIQVVREDNVRLGSVLAAHEEAVIAHAHDLLKLFGSMLQPSPGELLNPQPLLDDLPNLFPRFLEVGLISSNGQLSASSWQNRPAPSPGELELFQKAIRTRSFAMSGYLPHPQSEHGAVMVALPLPGPQPDVNQLLYAAIDLHWLKEPILRADLPNGSAIAVFDKKGILLARHPDLPEAQDLIGSSHADKDLFVHAAKGTSASVELPGLDDVHRLYVFTPVRTAAATNLFITLGIPARLAYADANRAMLVNLWTLVLVWAAALWIAHRNVQRHFLTPVSALVAAAKSLAHGNLAARVGHHPRIRELADLSTTFDQMAGNLQERQKELESAKDEISQLNETLEERVRQRTTELEGVNQELEAFSYSVSHDLRSPLRHIAGFVKMLENHAKDRLDAKGARYLTVIAQAAQKMGALIDDLLLFSRMGRQSLRVSHCPMNLLVEETVQELSADWEGRDVEWKIDSLPEVQADKGMIRQVWMNLIANAVKYTGPRQKPVIEIGCSECAEEYLFFVRDNGVGFDPAYSDKLFGVFQRLHRDDEFEGTGIGLANVRRIIHRHQGKTWADAKPDLGATFYFSLPKTNPTTRTKEE